MDRDVSLPDEYEMCCGKQRCPAVKLESECVLVHAPTPELEWFGGDTFEGGVRAGIRFTPDQARELKRWLEQKGF